MIWSVKKGDIIALPRHVYHYEVKNVNKTWIWLENTLTHNHKVFGINKLLNEAKLIRRTD